MRYRKTKAKQIVELKARLEYVYEKLRVAESVLLDLRLHEKAKNEGVDYDKMTIGSKIMFGAHMTFSDVLDDQYKYNKEG